jgi:uncharacterized damage-inducible protein DinB
MKTNSSKEVEHMDIKTIKIFANYNQITNGKMNEIIAKLTKEQWEKEFGGFYKSIRSLCNHIYIVDFNWLMRFPKLRQFEYAGAKIFDQLKRFDVMYLGNVEDYLEKRNEMDKYIDDFVNEIREEDLGKNLKYVDFHGKGTDENIRRADITYV